MSNPARPPTSLSTTQTDLASGPESFFQSQAAVPEINARFKTARSVEGAKEALKDLDMGLVPTLYLDKGLTVDPTVLASKLPNPLASAKVGGLSLRKRTFFGKEMVNAMYAELPDEANPFNPYVAKTAAAEQMRAIVFADAGTEGTIGRLKKFYPAKTKPTGMAPVTPAEAQQAMERCGLGDLWMETVYPVPIHSTEERDGIYGNPNAENGFPVGGKWSNPDARDRVLGLTNGILRELTREFRNAEMNKEGCLAAFEKFSLAHPTLVAYKGKAKADYYTISKIQENMMRFYNVVPRQLLQIMQQATQPLEAVARNIIDDYKIHSGIGITLAHGGANKLVSNLTKQLRHGSAFVHVGDDSWVIWVAPAELFGEARLCYFDLDCSSFDLTQLAHITASVHKELFDALWEISPISAVVWYSTIRKRRTVVLGTCQRLVKHAGPSGQPLQSKVNDMLMDVYIARLLARLSAYKKEVNRPLEGEGLEDYVRRLTVETGTKMGFTVKLGDFVSTPMTSSKTPIADALRTRHFLFVGYYFWADADGFVRCYYDPVRMLARMPFSGVQYEQDKDKLNAMEAIRLPSLIMNSGSYPPELRGFAEAGLRYAEQLLSDVAVTSDGALQERTKWALSENPFALEKIANAQGLSEALKMLQVLWDEPKPVVVVAAKATGGKSWADTMEDDHQEFLAKYGLERSSLPLPKAIVVKESKATTFPVTAANDGRPAPTSTWVAPTQAQLDAARQARARLADEMWMKSSNPGQRGRARKAAAKLEFYLGDDAQSEPDYDYEDTSRWDHLD